MFPLGLRKEAEELKSILLDKVIGKTHVLPTWMNPNSSGIAGDVLEFCGFNQTPNNKKAADWAPTNTELKVTLGRGNMSLGHLQPNKVECIGDQSQEGYETLGVVRQLIESHGWDHTTSKGEPTKRISLTVRSNYYHDRGFTMVHDEKADTIRMKFDSSKARDSKRGRQDVKITDWAKTVPKEMVAIEYRVDDIVKMLSKKLSSLLVTKYTRDGKLGLNFTFTTVTLYTNFSEEKCRECILDGTIRFEFAASRHHDHGVAMRIPVRQVGKLFENPALIVK